MQNLKKFRDWLPYLVCWACQHEVGWEEDKTAACVYKVMMIFPYSFYIYHGCRSFVVNSYWYLWELQCGNQL